jgi:hypothetical protein
LRNSGNILESQGYQAFIVPSLVEEGQLLGLTVLKVRENGVMK